MEIVKIHLENEMDLILAHKRSMKLAELCGMSVITQTSFATAVSEIARCVLGAAATLTLRINIPKPNRKELIASIDSAVDLEKDHKEAIRYASRLSSNLKVVKHDNKSEVLFIQQISYPGLINEARLTAFVNYFKNELPLSPYEELRKKNIQLLELSDKLRDSENQYRSLTETVPMMMFTTNAGGYLTHANKWLKDYFKLLDIPEGKTFWQNFLHLADSKVRTEWEKALSSQAPLKTQFRLKARAGEDPLWHLITLVPIKTEQNQLQSWTGFFVDIHAQKQVEETLKNNQELLAAQKQLLGSQAKLEEKVQELNRSNHDLEQFAYIASHDLQEPLRKIRSFSELASKNLENVETAKKYIERIDLSSSRMLNLIKDVLNYSRLTRTENVYEKTDLTSTIKNVMLDMELMLEEKKAIIKTESLPAIKAIQQQMYQLFYNLISNAIKFSEKAPRISIRGRLLPAAEVNANPELHKNTKYFEIAVEDNGIGFDNKYSRQVFTIFKRLHSKDSYSGTGIGLALCKKIVDNHHGLISVKSELGKGTTFYVLLPEE